MSVLNNLPIILYCAFIFQFVQVKAWIVDGSFWPGWSGQRECLFIIIARIFPHLTSLKIDDVNLATHTTCSIETLQLGNRAQHDDDPLPCPITLQCLPPNQLQTLVVTNSYLSPEGLDLFLFASHTSLRHLDLHGCGVTLLDRRRADDGTRIFPLLETLDLGYNDVTDAAMEQFLGCGLESTRITTLSLWNCARVGDATLKLIAASSPLLTSLDLSLCSLITDEGILALARCNFPLKCLALSLCYSLSDVSITALLKSSGSCLEDLDLERCSISDRSIHTILEEATRIKTLAMGSAEVTSQAIRRLGFGLTSLEVFDVVSSCEHVLHEDLSELQRTKPHLHIL